jgi:hypothetical protein
MPSKAPGSHIGTASPRQASVLRVADPVGDFFFIQFDGILIHSIVSRSERLCDRCRRALFLCFKASGH